MPRSLPSSDHDRAQRLRIRVTRKNTAFAASSHFRFRVLSSLRKIIRFLWWHENQNQNCDLVSMPTATTFPEFPPGTRVHAMQCTRPRTAVHAREMKAFFVFSLFLDAFTQRYERECPSVGPLVRRSVGPFIIHELDF